MTNVTWEYDLVTGFFLNNVTRCTGFGIDSLTTINYQKAKKRDDISTQKMRFWGISFGLILLV